MLLAISEGLAFLSSRLVRLSATARDRLFIVRAFHRPAFLQKNTYEPKDSLQRPNYGTATPLKQSSGGS